MSVQLYGPKEKTLARVSRFEEGDSFEHGIELRVFYCVVPGGIEDAKFVEDEKIFEKDVGQAKTLRQLGVLP